MTEIEKIIAKMSPAERKKAVEHLSNQMGMDPKIIERNRKRAEAARKTTKKTTKKK
jgi:hypothetical protein